MITHLSIGSTTIPDSQPGDAVELVISLDRPMPNSDYEVSVLRSVWMPDSEIKVTRKEPQQVTVTVTTPAGMAGAGMLHVLCTRYVGQDATGKPA